MTNKIYKTAQGKTVDLGSLILQNENVRAVGNMNVNARGDVIDADGNPIQTRNQQVNKNYQRQSTGPTPEQLRAQERAAIAEEQERQAAARAARETKRASGQTKTETPADQPISGLAAALAKAEQLKDEE